MTSADVAWRQLLDGNARHRAGTPTRHPGRPELTTHRPLAAVLACSDARAVPSDAFDADPGTLFEVRSAGHTLDVAALGSLEYAVGALHVPLLVVLGHTHCGAVAAARDVLSGGTAPTGALGDLIDQMLPADAAARTASDLSLDALGEQHVRRVAADLVARSTPIAAAVSAGRLTIRAAQLRLEDGSLRIFT